MITKLPEELQNNTLIMESMTQPNALIVFTDKKDSNGNDIIIALHLDSVMESIIVHDVKSMYGKQSLEKFIHKLNSNGCNFYVNNKTEQWVKSLGLRLPVEITNALSTYNDSLVKAKSQERLSMLEQIKSLSPKEIADKQIHTEKREEIPER